GECYYFLGRRYRLELIERVGKHEIRTLKSGKIKMYVNPGTAIAGKARLLHSWYRDELKKLIPELLEKWQSVIGKTATSWGVRKMKTKWGSCNIDARRIWLNLELAKKPPECLEYILVHELVHLHERNHNDRFMELIDTYLPNWRGSRKILNKAPLAHEEWKY
ncbi:MAG: M48 family metallopeptidase, partial [Gammaproteobacteria bacterium]|nr:M48 family metallopeptidase [Gammaproteobacteria bacterium]